MDRFYRNQPGAAREGKADSMYSVNSNASRASGYRNASTDSTNSRPTSTYTPSYMNAVPARKPAPVRTNGQSNGSTQPIEIGSPHTPSRRTPSTQIKKGQLLVLVAQAIHPSTVPYMETMLKRGAYSSIAIIGSSEYEKELKGLKIQIYALLGKLSHSSVGVQVDTKKTWSEAEIAAAIKANETGEAVHGVLCSPSYEGSQTGRMNMLELDEEQLKSPWQSSVGFLHAVAKAAIPNMRTTSGLFAVTGPTAVSPTTSFYKSACESLIDLLSEDSATSGVAIVHAENVLVPEPELAPQPQQTHSNGLHLAPTTPHTHDEPPDFAGGESPTKLYSMWAMHEQLGND